jgi:NADH:ubiquinone oxidoreductase subunit E
MMADVTTDDAKKMEELQGFIANLQGREYPHSYLIAVLHKAQELYRYLRKDVIQEISTVLDIPVSTIWGVATFYHYFNLEPRGEYVISLCLGTACYVKGSERVLETVKELLDVNVGETTPDMKFTLLTTRCLGTCALSPVMMINNRVYSQLNTKKVVSVINKLRNA